MVPLTIKSLCVYVSIRRKCLVVLLLQTFDGTIVFVIALPVSQIFVFVFLYGGFSLTRIEGSYLKGLLL